MAVTEVVNLVSSFQGLCLPDFPKNLKIENCSYLPL